MVYDYGCVIVGRPNYFTTSAEMRFFWLLLLIMNYSGETFTHICEWDRCSPSFGSSGSIFWILVVATVALGCVSLICFPLSFPLSGYDSELEHGSNLEAFILTTNDGLARKSLVLLVKLLWNSHKFPIFVFVMLFFSCGFGGLFWVISPWILPSLYSLEVPFPYFRFVDPKSLLFCLSLCLILTVYWYTMPSEEISRNSISS